MSDILAYAAQPQLQLFFSAIVFFHTSEFALAVAIHGKSCMNFSSFLISRQYMLAMVLSLTEYHIEARSYPRLNDLWLVNTVGLIMVVIGEFIRKLAIVTAGKSFSHLVRKYFDGRHKLVRHGIYAYIRHPSYCGFFLWAVGTQLILCNPVSTIVFTLVVWRFFHLRIPYEEFFLRQFFGAEYNEYARRTPSGIPLIK